MRKAVQRLILRDQNLVRLQANLAEPLEQVLRVPLIDGHLVEDVALTSSPLQLEHKLGRAYRGYLCTKANGQLYGLYDASDTNTQPERYLVLTYSGSATKASFWVF